MNNYLNIDASGSADLRDNSAIGNQAYYVEDKGNGQITLKIPDGRYLGISDDLSDGVCVKAVKSPYLWNVYSENSNDIYSLYGNSAIDMINEKKCKKRIIGPIPYHGIGPIHVY